MKVLVISNNCFAKNNSNGRILGCLFEQIDKNDVAQFYVIEGSNDFDVCSNYYMVSDADALKSLVSKKQIGRIVKKDDRISFVEKISEYRAKFGRTAFTSLSRNFVWKCYRWWNKSFNQWLTNFNPDIVILQCGDTPFMYDIAVRISKQQEIPLLLFNTEYDYFKNDSWFQSHKNSVIFKLFRSNLRTSIRKAYNHSSMSIYNSEWLKEKYDKEFRRPSVVIYQSSDFRLKTTNQKNDEPKIVYIGGLVYGRGLALVDIANSLRSINSSWSIEVYGLIQDVQTKSTFDATSNIIYKGAVPYSKAVRIIAESDLLLVVENPSPEYASLTNYGFSTKITDYLFSGIPILAYGSEDNIGIRYLKDNKAAVVTSKKEELKNNLNEVLSNRDLREFLIKNALSLAGKNHNAGINSLIFKDLVVEIVHNDNINR